MKPCEVRIFGQSYSLRAEMDEERIRHIAEMVDTRMREVAAASPSASALQVAVLAALDIAGEKQAAPVDAETVLQVEKRATDMMDMLDNVAPETQLV